MSTYLAIRALLKDQFLNAFYLKDTSSEKIHFQIKFNQVH